MSGRRSLKNRVDKIAEYSLIPWRKSIAEIIKELMEIEDKEHGSLLNKNKKIEDAFKNIEKRLSEIEKALQPLSER